MESILDIPYRSLPRQSELFLQYLERTPAAMQFYPCAPSHPSLGPGLCESVLCRGFERSRTASILRRQNRSYGCGEATLQSIDALEDPDCVAVLTGQQTGLFAAPLLTVYKALTAVRLAGELRDRGIRAVAVFWMETEDHDLAEVTRLTVLGRDDDARTADYGRTLFGDTRASVRPVGSLRFPEAIRDVVRDFSRNLPDSEWRDQTAALIASAYGPGDTFPLSFARLLHRILHDSGLILFDPRDPEAKPLVSDVFRWALEHAEDIGEAIALQDRKLRSARFHSQVRTGDEATVLFYIDNGERHALLGRGSRFRLKHTGRPFTLRQLERRLEEDPGAFSPNVLLRPIVEDTLFPTLAVVAGPAEVAYFAQVQALYALGKLPMPVVWPRAAFTLLAPRVRRAMESSGAGIGDLFDGAQPAGGRAAPSAGRQGAQLEAFGEKVRETFSGIRPDLAAVDPELPGALDTAERKILHNIGRLIGRLDRTGSPAGFWRHHCLPNGRLQERELGIAYFLSLLGPSVLDTIRSGIRTGDFSHRVLSLGL